MEAPLLDLETNVWTDYTFPKDLEPGVQFDGGGYKSTLESDGTLLFYYNGDPFFQAATLYVYNPQTDTDGTWQRHPIENAFFGLFGENSYKLNFIF